MSKELIIFSDFFSVLHEKINCFLRAGSERPRWKDHPSVAFNYASVFAVGASLEELFARLTSLLDVYIQTRSGFSPSVVLHV